MGIANFGIVRAEGVVATTAQATDRVLLQTLDPSTNQYSPRQITVSNLLTSGSTGITPGSVIFAGTNGVLTGNSTDLSFNDTTNVLTVSGDVSSGGNFVVTTAGKGLQIKSGTNARIGTATLAAGTVTVSNTSVTTSTRIFLTVQSLGTVSAPQPIAVTAQTAGASFVITSSDNTDTSVVAWMLVESN
jgi:hypothetical protein